ncbi:hypothetical protein B296_00016458 [Ensete ventricosum]|uniref:Uncharacterized protein n=1 Tax=Ensete ventricosum TaxID=4639 RepID=A0A426ZDU0_ENSVE|nr:hypothetical protein B296_00016458 [Ensete ventricosum]
MSDLRISSRRLACATGSSANTTLDLSFTPAVSRNSFHSLALSRYINFMSNGCNPVLADSTFFSSPASRSSNSSSTFGWSNQNKAGESVGVLTEGGLGADADLVVRGAVLDLDADHGGDRSGRGVGLRDALLNEQPARPDLPLLHGAELRCRAAAAAAAAAVAAPEVFDGRPLTAT